MRIPNRLRKHAIDRDYMARPMNKTYLSFMQRMMDGLMSGVKENSDQIRAYLAVNYPTLSQQKRLRETKALSESDRLFFMNLFSKYGMEREAQEFVREIANVNIDNYNKAAQFALSKLKLTNVRFSLTNPYLITKLEKRAETFPASSKVAFQDSVTTIQERFIEQGLAPYDSKFFRDIQNDLGYLYEYEAIRYARSETGHVQSAAQFDLYEKNGVEGKEWTTATFGVRPTHQDVVIFGTKRKYGRMDETFNVGGHEAQYPLDSSLPAKEFCNCRCDIMPYFFNDEFTVPRQVWNGS